MHLGERVQTIRKRKGWTQAELAEAAHLSTRTIQRLEAGFDAGVHTLRSVAEVLGTTPEDLRAPKGERRDTPPNGGEFLPRLSTGTEVAQVVGGSYASSIGQDDPVNQDELELLASFQERLQDCGDFWNDFEPAERLRATFQLQGELEELEAAGFVVFGAQVIRRLKLQAADRTEAVEWPVAAIRIVRSTNPEIRVDKSDVRTIYHRVGDVTP